MLQCTTEILKMLNLELLEKKQSLLSKQEDQNYIWTGHFCRKQYVVNSKETLQNSEPDDQIPKSDSGHLY